MFTGECRFSKSRGLSANFSFLPLPLPQFPVFGSCSFLTWPENPVPRVFLCSKQKHLLHRLHRRLGVDFSFRWSMFDSWPRYFFSFNFVLYFFNHIFFMYWLVSLHSYCCPFNNNFTRCFMVTCTLACIYNLTCDLCFVPATWNYWTPTRPLSWSAYQSCP